MRTEFASEEIQERLRNCSTFQTKSTKVIGNLYREGEEFVTNVVTTTENEEAARRLDEQLETARIFNFVAEEQTDAENLFNQVITKWHNVNSEKIPNVLLEFQSSQKIECQNVLREKDETIAALREELENKHEESKKKRDRCEEETKVICQRIAHLIHNLNETSKSEVQLIKDSLNDVQDEMARQCSKMLEENFVKKQIKNEKYDCRRETVLETARNLRGYHLARHDELASLRRDLDQEMQQLLIKLKQVEASQFLNMDKLLYGLRVLKHQLKEGRVKSSELKRNNIRSFDVILGLRTKLKSVNETGENQCDAEIVRFNKTQERLAASIKASKVLHCSHKRSFSDLFEERDGQARKYLHSVLKVEKFLHEKLLSIKWKPPDLSFLNSKIISESSKEGKLLERLQAFLVAGTDEHKLDDPISNQLNSSSPEETTLRLKRPLDIEMLLGYVCDNLDFLLDKQVLKLAKDIFPNKKTFILSNSVFNAMGIVSTEDLYMLIAYVLHYGHQINEDIIEVNNTAVLIAFNDFIKSHNKNLDSDGLSCNINLNKDYRQEPQYWKQYTAILPEENFWDAIFHILKTYKSALEDYHRLNKKKSILIRQNEELHELLSAN